MVLWKKNYSDCIRSYPSMAEDGLHTDGKTSKTEISPTYRNDLYYTVHLLKCKMFSCNNTLYKSTFWRRRRAINSQVSQPKWPHIAHLVHQMVSLWSSRKAWEQGRCRWGLYARAYERILFCVVKKVMVRSISVQMGEIWCLYGVRRGTWVCLCVLWCCCFTVEF